MTTTPPTAAVPNPAWQRYLDREHAARDMYLRTTAEAHHEYLIGPWPDRDTYTAVERTAWQVYHAAGRAAWTTYLNEIGQPLPPDPTKPAGSYPYPSYPRVAKGPVTTPGTMTNPSEQVTGAPWPASAHDYPQPMFPHPTESGS